MQISFNIISLLPFFAICLINASTISPKDLQSDEDTPTTASSACPDGWKIFGDSKCLKLSMGQQKTYEEAQSICAEENPDAILPTINSAEEQSALAQLVVQEQPFWLGAEVNNSNFKWMDDSHYEFSKLAPHQQMPSGSKQYCLEMETDTHDHGMWVLLNCHRKRAVVCQKSQDWTSSRITRTLMSMRTEVEAGLSALEEDVALLKRMLLGKANGTTAALLEESFIPVGFIYVQYGQQQGPREIWPQFTWQDISNWYPGQFFRVVGGAAGSFGQVQSCNSPRLTDVTFLDEYSHPTYASIPASGTSQAVRSGYYSSNGDVVGMKFTQSGGEVRPLNSAVRMWKRIQ